MIRTAVKACSLSLLGKIAVTGTIAAILSGVFAGSAVAVPPFPPDRPYQQDCDHTGQWSWQMNRGQDAWTDCSLDGVWILYFDKDLHGEWFWQHNLR